MNDRHSSRNAGLSYAVPLYDTTGLTSALTSPYAQYMSSHYYQAYMQGPRPCTTADGYTLSSTYVPGTASRTSGITSTAITPPLRNQPSVQAQSHPAAKPIQNHLTYGSWYQPGNSRCTRRGCPFTGSHKSVETHMMDRHFIFPPGWKKKDGWDADPSLRGKPMAIQGTSLMLDTPEAIDAWIAERKKRFPTEERARDKKRKLEDAVARGQLTAEDMGVGARKKYRQNAEGGPGSKGFRGKGHQRGGGRRWERPIQPEEPRAENVDSSTRQPVTSAKTMRTREASPSPASTADEAPEVASSKVSATSLCIPKVDATHDEEAQKSLAYARCPGRPQPRKPPRNPFASRSTLLRNLLLPEIRATVSNISQAIRFLVENDFLRGVELQPGEAQERMIEVLGSSGTPYSALPPAPEELSNLVCKPGIV